jgi:hypothetical protein
MVVVGFAAVRRRGFFIIRGHFPSLLITTPSIATIARSRTSLYWLLWSSCSTPWLDCALIPGQYTLTRKASHAGTEVKGEERAGPEQARLTHYHSCKNPALP